MSLSKSQFVGLTVFLVILINAMILVLPHQQEVRVVEKVVVKESSCSCPPSTSLSSAAADTSTSNKSLSKKRQAATRRDSGITMTTEGSTTTEEGEEDNPPDTSRRPQHHQSLQVVHSPPNNTTTATMLAEIEEPPLWKTSAIPSRKDFVPKDLTSFPSPPTIEEARNSTVARWVLNSQRMKSFQAFRDFWKIEAENHENNPGQQPRVNSIVIEVGTNVKPDYCPAMKWNKQTALIGIEPMPVFRTHAYKRCCKARMGARSGRCVFYGFGLGNEDKWMKLQVAKGTGTCSSFLALKSKDEALQADCNVLSGTVDALVVTLDTLFELVLPPHLPISVLSLDMQGYDIYGVSGLKNPEYRSRVGNLVLECQDVTEDSPKLIYPGGGTCMQAKMCIEEHWPSDWKFVGCWRNMGPKEYNCVWANTAHPFGTKQTRPAWDPIKKKLTGATGPPHFPTQEAVSGCPEYFLTTSAVRT